MLVSPNLLFEYCYGRFAIAAVNVFTLEQVHGLFRAAEKANAPFIVQTTPAARQYAHSEMLVGMIRTASRIYSRTVFALHLDHGTEPHIQDAINSGEYTSVMIDASHEPFRKNIQRTKAVVEQAHSRNIFVEAELGVLSGAEDDSTVGEGESLFTDPGEAESFVKQTQCDSLAIAVGTSHGAFKFQGGTRLRLALLREIQHRLPGYPLVLHGASGILPQEVARVNAAGGNIGPGASGVKEPDLKEAIGYGICKVNIATDARILWARVHREFFRDSPELFDPVIPGKTYMKEFARLMADKFDVLGASGRADGLKLY